MDHHGSTQEFLHEVTAAVEASHVGIRAVVKVRSCLELKYLLTETNIALQNGWLEDEPEKSKIIIYHYQNHSPQFGMLKIPCSQSKLWNALDVCGENVCFKWSLDFQGEVSFRSLGIRGFCVYSWDVLGSAWHRFGRIVISKYIKVFISFCIYDID